MPLQFHAFTLPLVLSALISLFLGLLILQRRNVKGGLALAALMFELSWWAGAEGVLSTLYDLPSQFLWLRIAHSAVIGLPLTFLLFVAQLTDNDDWVTPTSVGLLAVGPAFALLMIWMNPSGFSYYSAFQSVPVNGFPEIVWGRGPAFWLDTAYAYVLVAAAVLILVRAFMRAGSYIRIQLATVLFGCLAPWVVDIFVLLSPNASRNPDLTPLSASASALIFAYALFRQRLLDVVPVARSMLFEKFGDGVLVLDKDGRILDANLAVQRVLQIGKYAYGRHIWEVLPQWSAFAEVAGTSSAETHVELQSPIDPARFFDVSIISLLDGRGRQNGHLVSFRDITERKSAETELHKMNARLQRQVRKISALHDELREQAVRDPLTGLFNRRYLDETLARELSRARRANYPISIIMLDIDQFKLVNDTHGHKAGDRVLKTLGGILCQQIRAGDFACRFGGEEFVVVMPDTPADVACERMEQIRICFRAARFFKFDRALAPSLSIGIASFPSHGRTADKVLHAADSAMYAAKAAGGNMALLYDARRKTAIPESAKKLTR